MLPYIKLQIKVVYSFVTLIAVLKDETSMIIVAILKDETNMTLT